MVQCPHCGQENPPQYRFCGMCGKAIPVANPALPKQAAPVPSVPVTLAKEPAPAARQVPKEAPKAVSRTEDVPFSGPSFLGLSGGGSSNNSAEYLLEDEAPSSGRAKMVITLLLLLVAAGLLGWKWRFGNFPWQSTSNAPATTTTAQSNTPASTPNTAAPAVSTPTRQTPADSTNPQNQAAPQNVAPRPAQPADNSAAPAASDSSAAANSGSDTSKAAQPATSDVGQASSGQASSEQADAQNSDNQAAEKPAAPAKPAVKQTAATPKSTPRKAVAEDDSPESEAQALLTQGERYLNGNGVPQNCGRAQDSLRSAADRGSFQAVNDLATMYSTGHCVKKDLPTAYRWFVKALHQQPNNSRISTDLQVLWNQMSPEEKQVAMQK